MAMVVLNLQVSVDHSLRVFPVALFHRGDETLVDEEAFSPAVRNDPKLVPGITRILG